MKETKEAESNVPLRLPQSERNDIRFQPAARIPFTVVQFGHHDDALGQMNNGCVGDGFVDAFLLIIKQRFHCDPGNRHRN